MKNYWNMTHEEKVEYIISTEEVDPMTAEAIVQEDEHEYNCYQQRLQNHHDTTLETIKRLVILYKDKGMITEDECIREIRKEVENYDNIPNG